MRQNRKHKRNKVQIRYLERRLYKTERRIDQLHTEAFLLRKTIKSMKEQEAKKKADREVAVNKALHDAAIQSVPVIGGTKDASNT